MSHQPFPDSNAIVALLKRFSGYKPHKQEKTIFSIGGRGHYENPVTDVLAFYMDPNEDHELGSFVLDAFIRVAKSKVATAYKISVRSFIKIKREECTGEKKRIDLVVIGDDWVIVIENKIFHSANNPFEEYKKHIRKKFSKKEHFYFVLSPKNSSADGWHSISYQSLIAEIRTSLGQITIDCQFSKWHVFLRDFLLNLEFYCGRKNMDDSKFEFLNENMNEIYKLNKVKEEFETEVQARIIQKLTEVLPDHDFSPKAEPIQWYGCPSFRFTSPQWSGDSKIVFVTGLGLGEPYMLKAYRDQLTQENLDAFKLACSPLGAAEIWLENSRWGVCELKDQPENYDEALEKFADLAVLADTFLSPAEFTVSNDHEIAISG